MLKKNLVSPFAFFPFFLSLLGIGLCAWNVFAKDSVFCLTDSCNVFNDFSLLGISLWVCGTLLFTLLALLFLFRQNAFASCILFLALLGDTLLLILMFATAPCFNCLIVAALIGLSFYWIHRNHKKKNLWIQGIFIVWLCLFLINVSQLIKNTVTPFPIYTATNIAENPKQALIRIYFSPSCSACQESVALLGNSQNTNASQIAWYPVSENSNDIQYIYLMKQFIIEGDSLSLALEKALNTILLAPFLNLETLKFLPTQIKVLVNQAHLNKAGTTAVPFIETIGLPAHLKQNSLGTNPLEILQNVQTNSSTNPFATTFCDNSSSEPCNE